MADAQSQWDFGEMFRGEPTREVLTVSDLTTRVKRELENRIGQIWVEGEITNLRRQSSGHAYFSLKDARTQLSCVLFRGVRGVQRGLMEDGQKVMLQGDLTVYEARGQYQLIVRAVELQGVGALQVKFEKLKAKLQAEGFFDPERKRTLPRFTQRIGVVTSLSGAALRDVLHVVSRRQPALQIVLADSRVQGRGAEVGIAKGIEWLNEWVEREPLDLILLTRGGGSLEDLWAFNEETLARAIVASAVPVLSAVGHEIDFTISDFTADYRAATPSAAAEIITAGAVALEDSLKTTRSRLQRLIAERCAREQERVGALAHRLRCCHPRRRLQDQMQRVDELHDDLLRAAQSIWKHNERRWRGLAERQLRVRPELIVARQQAQLAQLRDRLQELPERQVSRAGRRIKALVDQLRLLGPENVLARGYSITQDAKTGEVLRAASTVKTGQKLRTRLADGEVESTAG